MGIVRSLLSVVRVRSWHIGYTARLILASVLMLGFLLTGSHAVESERQKIIMQSTKRDVDALLKDWSSRKSSLSTAGEPIYYYTKDVSVIVHFRDDKAVGVAVIDRPGAGVTSISQTRYDELVKLIGQEPKPGDIKRDSSGIHEFYVGDTD